MLPLLPVLVCLGALQAASAAEIITIPLRDVLANGQQAFVADMAVGTPPQSMAITVDINGIPFVNSVRCSDPFCTSHKQYDSSASSTYEADGTAFDFPYGLNASGVLSKDAIGLAGVTVQSQLFGESTAVWNDWSLQAPNDGVLGLGFVESSPSILDSMADQGLIDSRVAGLWLGRGGVGGELTLGGVNSDRFSGDLTWAPIAKGVVTADSVSLGDMVLCPGDCPVGAFTGSPYFFMQMEAAALVNDALGGMDIGQPGVAALDCDTLDSLPSLQIVIPGLTMEMSALEYTFILPLADGAQMCISGFVGVPDITDGVVSVGTLFLQKYYTTYDMETMQAGIADSA